MDEEVCPFGVDTSTWKMCQGVECKDYDLFSISVKLQAKHTIEEVVECLGLNIDELQSAKCDDEFSKYHWVLIKWLEKNNGQAQWHSLLSCLSKLQDAELLKSVCDLIRQPQDSCTGDNSVVAVPETNPAQTFQALKIGQAAVSPYEDTDDIVASDDTSISSKEYYGSLVTGRAITDHNLDRTAVASPRSRDINVKRSMRKLQTRFASLLSKTLKACHEKDTSVSDFRLFITQRCVDEKNHIPFFEERMMEIISHTSVEQTFLLLSRIGAWDFLNFHLVDEIMDECSLDEVREDMISYKESVNEFKENTKLVDFLHFWDGRSKEDSLPDRKAVIAKLQNDAQWSEIKLADVSHTEQHLVGEFHLKPYIMQLANGFECSVYIMWLVPMSAARKMEEQMEAGLPNLAKLGIQELVIGRKIFKVCGFQTIYQDSLTKSAAFWAAQAKGYLKWDKLFERVDESDINEGIVRWFTGGKLNVSVNCLDRHVDSNPDSIAIIWEQDEQGKHENITYKMLLEMTCKVANVLTDKGVKKGERVIIYLPAMPLAIASMLACARIGAVHCILYSSLGYQALSKRITDTGAKVIITANVRVVSGQDIPLKTNVDKALEVCQHQVEHVLVAKRKPCDHTELCAFPRDTDLDKAMEKKPSTCKPVSMNSNDDLFVIYTSGTTGNASEPKGIVSSQAGYLLYAAITHKFVFDHKPGDVMGCMADLGWIAGQTLVVYGPLCNGGTTTLFESTACYPDCWRYWEVTQRLKITQMFITPYVVKSLMKKQASENEGRKKEFDTSSLRVIATGGEPLQTFVMDWIRKRLGKGKCTFIDTWAQTETGSVALVTWYPPKDKSCKPPSHYPTDSKSFAFFGVEPVLLKQEDKKGLIIRHLCFKRITPGMGKAIQSSSPTHSFKQSYFITHPGHYYTYDQAELDSGSAVGHILGRVDDAVRIKGIWADTPYIESVMEQADQRVQETLLIACKCSDKQSTSCAFVGVTSKTLSQKKEQESLLDQMKKELSSRELDPPQKFIFTEARLLPKTLSGKNIRKALKEIANAEFSTESNNDVIDLPSEKMEDYRRQYAHSNLAPLTPPVH